MHQNAPNCTILKLFLGEGSGMPPNPPSKAHGFQIWKKKFLAPPPPRQIMATPLVWFYHVVWWNFYCYEKIRSYI